MTGTPDAAMADLQTANAALRQQLAERDADNRALIARQQASIEVLRAISASPDDAQPVLGLIVRHARTLCNAQMVHFVEYDGSLLHQRAVAGYERDPEALARFLANFPRPPGPETVPGRVVLSGRPVHITDQQNESGIFEPGRALGARSYYAMPLLREARIIGVLVLGRHDPGDFDQSAIDLVQSFAEQAVIALSSAAALRELRQRTSDLQESLEHQTATSEVLKVISRSTFDLRPVLDTVVETAARLCEADRAAIFRREGDLYRLAVNFGFPREWEDTIRALGAFPIARFSGHAAERAVAERRPVHIDDVAVVSGYGYESVRLAQQRTTLGVPLLREGEAIGTMVLARLRVEPFTERQIELVTTFADQAVIAIENTRLITEQWEALEQQTATAEVLQVINASPGNLAPVFETMLDRAMRLCEAEFGELFTYDGERFIRAAGFGIPPALAEYRLHHPTSGVVTPGTTPWQILQGASVLHIPDLKAEAAYIDGVPMRRAVVDLGGMRTCLAVALRKDTTVLGNISIYRKDVRLFSDRQVALLRNFAEQAVIAMENARLIDEQREALEQQTATAEVLQVINASQGNIQPVFDAMLEKAMRLCDVSFGMFNIHDGASFRTVVTRGVPAAFAAFRAGHPPAPSAGSPFGRAVQTRRVVHVVDWLEEAVYRDGTPGGRAIADLGGARTVLNVPLVKEDAVLGVISFYRQEVRAFSNKQIALLESFGSQAVIAMESARLLNELRARTDELAQRQAELRVTFENMGDGVAMFDETPRLVAWNRKFQDILDLPDGILDERPAFADYIRYLARRGEFGVDADPDTELRRVIDRSSTHYVLERRRPDGRVIEIRHNPVTNGGFVLIYADITERKRNEAEIAAARDAAQEATRTIEVAFRDLKTAQANLVQAEKMASLGQLTAGIAHEIKNPLNFVNNFASLSVDLLAELKETAAPGFATLTDDQRADIDEVSAMLTSNLQKITEHGKRADGIVRAMLEHSRGASGERRTVDINALVDEALNLAYHGARAQDQSFNIALERDFTGGIAPIELNPQDITRVFLNLFSNGFYAASKRARDNAPAGFQPTLAVATRDLGDRVEIRVRDNGTGIPEDIRDKLFEPFFTTKPTGEGTGLGLSITYDIVTKQHGGTIEVESAVGDHTAFSIGLPRQMFAAEGAVA